MATSRPQLKLTRDEKAHYGIAFSDKDGLHLIDQENELEKLVDYLMRFSAGKKKQDDKSSQSTM
ncbi:hypothetical protein E6C27_scaffold501G00220 [Cucumis melo var. makuwa]|uniref:Uncharacterized protein n=2 Tax=Cucumis melo TaxID=3656 RepID=A0A5A7V5A0_CUCMM|nr:hypothetical protein E6C27_scaffold501G00220 [Cucumis melo var. makuwa]